MWNAIKRFIRPKRGQPATQVPLDIFKLPKDTTLIAEEEVTFAFPTAMLGPNERIGDVIKADADVLFSAPSDLDVIYLRLRKGMQFCLAKSVEGRIVPDKEGDVRPRRLRVVVPPKTQ